MRTEVAVAPTTDLAYGRPWVTWSLAVAEADEHLRELERDGWVLCGCAGERVDAVNCGDDFSRSTSPFWSKSCGKLCERRKTAYQTGDV